MQKRQQVVYHELIRLTKSLSAVALSELSQAPGFDATTISNNLGIARNSVSQELNQLHLAGKVLKIKSRPVYFLDKASYEAILGQSLSQTAFDEQSWRQLLPASSAPLSDPFSQLIGYARSLKSAVEKGRAAVLYPGGLHVLLTGESGVGKTYFAELMHQLAEHQQQQSLPFIYFNCAEYYHNQELLSSHLFGHRQGAFTGATQHKTGLVAQADGGFLLLDEVHRLSHESQEKLFLIIDKGEFQPLGASGKPQKVNVKLICATTENIQSSLLRTFLRRIQVQIALPPLEQRSLEERLALVMHFLNSESNKIGRTIAVDKMVLSHLLQKTLPGNIGQLKSDIQFLCAQAWMEAPQASATQLILDKRLLPEAVLPTAAVKALLEPLFKSASLFAITTHNQQQLRQQLAKPMPIEERDRFYTFITQEYVNLRNSQVSPQETLSILKQKLKNIFDYTIHQQQSQQQTYLQSEQLQQRISRMIHYLQSLLGFALNPPLISLLQQHFVTLLSYVHKGLIPNLYSASLLQDHCQDEYDNAVQICKRIEAVFFIQCPSTEIVYWCLFLKECRLNQRKQSLSQSMPVIFIAHGDTTATSMANYVNRVLEYELISAIDMPFEQSVHDTLDLLIAKVKQSACRQLILIVDTGSLVHFGNVIHQLFGIEVLLLHNITLAGLLDFSLDLTYEAKDFAQIVQQAEQKQLDCKLCNQIEQQREQVLLISCVTGMGTAVKIKKVLEESFAELMSDTKLLIVDYQDIRSPERLRQVLQQQQRMVGIIGTFQPGLPDIPFISLEELFSEQGPELVISLLHPHLHPDERQQLIAQSTMKFIGALSLESIINQISVLNPRRILQEIEAIYHHICHTLALNPSQQVTLRFLIHCCCMVERIVISRKPLQMALDDQPTEANYALSVIKAAFLPIEQSYTIQLSDAEYHYIYELLFA